LVTAPANQSPISGSSAELNGDDRDERRPRVIVLATLRLVHPGAIPKADSKSRSRLLLRSPLSPSVLFLVSWASLCSSPIKKLVETLA
jgi:hypothetical protein